MPRKIFKKYMPDEQVLKKNRYLHWLGEHLQDPALWQFNRKSISKAVFVGVFCAFIPVPFQMIIAALIALIFRVNLPVSVGLVWLTNPITIPPIFYICYLVGGYVLDIPEGEMAFEMSLEWISDSFEHIIWPLLVGSMICGLFLATLSYLAIRYYWIWHITSLWRKRRHK